MVQMDATNELTSRKMLLKKDHSSVIVEQTRRILIKHRPTTMSSINEPTTAPSIELNHHRIVLTLSSHSKRRRPREHRGTHDNHNNEERIQHGNAKRERSRQDPTQRRHNHDRRPHRRLPYLSATVERPPLAHVPQHGHRLQLGLCLLARHLQLPRRGQLDLQLHSVRHARTQVPTRVHFDVLRTVCQTYAHRQ